MAIRYVGRFATTRARLAAYLQRKITERGWAGEGAPPVEALVERMAAAGYVDDRAFAAARTASLARRGYGARRQADALRAAGVTREDAAALRDAEEDAEGAALAAARAFARRKRLGPWGGPADPDKARRQLAAMLRAGHDFAVARLVLGGSALDCDDEVAD